MAYEFHQGVILHARPYKETSYLLTLWLKGIGKTSGIIKGARSKKRANLCQPFSLLNIKIKLAKSSESLSIIQSMEQEKYFIQGTYLAQLSRLYLNELLYWLLPHDHCDKRLFEQYLAVIEHLNDDEVKSPLRYFELQLLNSLGYSFQCDLDEDSNPIEADLYYLMQPLSPFYRIFNKQGIQGKIIHKINHDMHLWNADDARIIQKLIRINLDACLGTRELKTRQLLQHYLLQKA